MKEIVYYIKNLAPVAFTEKNNDATLLGSRNYIPGAAVRGQLIENYIRDNNLTDPGADENFNRFFFQNKVRFLPAYPIYRGLKNEAEAMLAPLSLMKDKVTNEIEDNAAEQAPELRAGLKKWSGFVNYCDGTFYPIEVETQAQLHMQRTDNRNRLLGHSDDGAIYNYEYIEPEQLFKGKIIVDDEIADKIYRFIQDHMGKNIYIGHSRKAQYGCCRFNCYKPKAIVNEKMAEDKRIYFYAQTTYLPLAPWQDLKTVIEELLAEIKQELKNIDSNIELKLHQEKIWAAQEEVNGFVTAWQARQPRIYGVAAGSLWGVEISNRNSEVLSKLEEILARGLGQRTEEGYGQFKLWQSRNFIFADYEKEIIKPEKLSSATKNKAKAILQKRALLEIAIKAGKLQIKSGDSKKHILKRIEILMDSDASKDEIMNCIRDFKDIARRNLENIYIDYKDKLYRLDECLLEKSGGAVFYKDMNWKKLFNLKERDMKSLFTDIGINDFISNEDEAYRTFWFWFARHNGRRVNKKG